MRAPTPQVVPVATMSARTWTLVVVVASLVVAATLPAAGVEDREQLDVRVFAEVPSPGQPEGIAVGSDGTIYVGTHNHGKGDAEAPSKVFAYAPDGTLKRDYVIEGQNLEEDHGILGITPDADDRLFILDRNPARILVLDPATGQQWDHATFRDVPPCALGGEEGDCSGGVLDLAEFPDYSVFAPDGTLYVTDLEQALIWRVPPGGGEAEVWFTDDRLESVFGPNGIQFMADGRTLLFAQTGSNPPGTDDAATGKLYTVEVQPDGSPGELEVFWEGRPVDGPDGFAIAESGNVYVALAGANQVLLLSPEGEELARVPATPLHNAAQEVPFDTPASVAFHGERVLVTNQSFFAGNSDNWVVFDVFAGEEGLPLFRPDMPTAASTGTAQPGAPERGSDEGRAIPATGGSGAAGLLLLIGAAAALTSARRPIPTNVNGGANP